MRTQTDINLSRVAMGKTKRRKLLLREASIKYMNFPKIRKPWKSN